MKNTLLTLIALFITSFTYAQESDVNNWMQSDGSLEGFVVGKQYFSMVSDANLREKSNTQSTVITKLAIATPVEIISVSTDSLSLRGVKLPWVQVRTKAAGKPEQTGSGAGSSHWPAFRLPMTNTRPMPGCST